jgi:patatin-related protein
MAGGYEPTHQARFAVVMYGGVSLAIYINGVAQELYRLVEATAPSADSKNPFLTDEQLCGAQTVYREIARRRQGGGKWRDEGDASDWPIACRAVVDILSGTSAGGINSIFLGKALAENRHFDALQRLWVEVADINQLWSPMSPPPHSVLSGTDLHKHALEALRSMAPRVEGDVKPQLAERVDLAVTTTDLQGLWLPFMTADGSIDEPRHRLVFNFASPSDETTGEPREDFDGQDEMLAFAARATSSFPAAFEPVRASDVDGDGATPSEGFAQWFAEYTRAGISMWREIAFADGGFLDNKPFTSATAALRRRRGDVPVDRALLYIEPDPQADPKLATKLAPRPDAIHTAVAGVTLARSQPIRSNIAELAQRNLEIGRIRAVTREVGLAALEETGRERAANGKRELAPAADDPGQPLAAVARGYLLVRRTQLIDDLLAIALHLSERRPGGDMAHVLRILIEAVVPTEEKVLRARLAELDVRFRLRRLAMLQDRLDDLLRGDGGALLAAAGVDISPEPTAGIDHVALRDCKANLNTVFVDLRAHDRSVWVADPAASGDGPLVLISQALASLRVDSDSVPAQRVQDIVRAADPRARAVEQLPRARESLKPFVEALAAQRKGFLAQTDEAIADQLMNTDAALGMRGVLSRYNDCFETIDTAVFPLEYPDLGETNPVAIYRVSPKDTHWPLHADVKRLAGDAMHHFGGFLDKTWRQNDILWGRLDGADRLIVALVPLPEARETFKTRAHAAILREEFSAPEAPVGVLAPEQVDAFVLRCTQPSEGADDDANLVTAFCNSYRGPQPLHRAREAELGFRGAEVATRVLAPALSHDLWELIVKVGHEAIKHSEKKMEHLLGRLGHRD